MIRRILLAVISLAIILACYMLYTMLFVPPGSEEPTTPRTTSRTALPIRPTTRPNQPVNFTSPEDAVTGGMGEKPYFERYSRNRLLYQFRSDHWRPIGTGSGRFALDKPELNLCLRSGQVLRVSAAEGEVETVQSKTSKMEPKRGELRGRVHIAIDRGTDPTRTAPELRPEDITHIWLDRVKFDLVQNTLESESPIKAESEEVELIGEAISISWNSVTNQIEDITIKRGDKLVLRQGIDMLSPDMPFSEKTQKAGKTGPGAFFGSGANGPAAARGAGPAGRMMFTRQTVAKSDLVYPAATGEKPTTGPTTRSGGKRHRTSTQSSQPHLGRPSYDLVFTSAVRILQYDGQKLAGKMNCDRLHVLFDVPRSSEGPGLGTRPAKTTSRPVLAKDNKRIEIFWEGPLQMLPKEMPFSPVRRVHILAEGLPVVIDQMEQGTVRCKKLTYHQESKQLWLDGTADEPVNVAQGEARMIVAPHLFYDRKLGTASGKGPGFMQQQSTTTQPAAGQAALTALDANASPGQKMMVLWKEGFQLNFGEYDKTDATGQRTTRQFIKRAEFRGSASLRRMGELMAGDLVVINFLGPNLKDGRENATDISMLHAERNVTLQSDTQQINCGLLDVEFGDGNFGRIPKRAKARGSVQAREGQRVIRADLLTAAMEDRLITPPTTTKPGSGLAARKKPKTKVILREVDASGNVTIVDPSQQVDVDAQKMHAILDADGTIRWCYLEGTDKKWARAKLRDYDVTGEKVTMDLTTEQIDIPGPGDLKFINKQDILGGERAKPTPIAIAWTDSMKMTGGKKNQGTFLGQTKVQSDRTTLYCEKMLIDFENAEAPPKAPAKSTIKDHLWVFSRVVEKPEKDTMGMQVPLARKRPTYIQAFPAPGQRISVQYLVKEGKTPLNRTTLWGNELTVDLASSKLNVPGPGEFFIEDYRRSDKAKAAKAQGKSSGVRELDDPFAGDFQSSGPAKTAFTWQTGLVYLLDSRTAIFDGMVHMLHAAGPEALAAKPGADAKAKPAGRLSELSCDNLKVEFVRGGLGFGDSMQPGAAGLKSVVATGKVHLKDKPRSVMAPRLLYNQADRVIAVYGDDQNDAYLYEENEETGQYSMMHGPWILWDRKTGEIQCPNVAVDTTLR